MQQANEWIEDRPEESVALSIPAQYRNLSVESTDMSVRQLWNRYIAGELIIEPSFQRHYVWDAHRASRFIESLLLDLPIPPLFLSETSTGDLQIVDGHQRLETLFRFMRPLLSGPAGSRRHQVEGALGPSLTLSGCEVLVELNGRGVNALNQDERARLWDKRLQIIIVKKDSHPEMTYVLFSRLNMGSMALNPQEMRNCLYRGPYNDLIRKIAESPEVMKAFRRRGLDRRMADRERVLRFFALAHRRSRYRTPFRSFLNDEMVENREVSRARLAEFEEEYIEAFKWTQLVFPGTCFQQYQKGNARDPNGYWGGRLVTLVYETEMIGFYDVRERLESVWESLAKGEQELATIGLRHNLIDVMTSDAFLQTIATQTTTPHVLRRRFDLWLGRLSESLVSFNKTIELAEKIVKLQRASTACSLCPQHVTSVEDAVVVEVGGREALAHRYCCTANHIKSAGPQTTTTPY